MKEIKEKLVNEYPLTKKMDCPLESYRIKLYSYVVFYDEKITKENSLSVYNAISDATEHFPKGKILYQGKELIVVGHTDEEFERKDLFVCIPRSEEPFVAYYLKNDKTGKFYFSDEWALSFGLHYRKVIKRFNEILNP